MQRFVWHILSVVLHIMFSPILKHSEVHFPKKSVNKSRDDAKLSCVEQYCACENSIYTGDILLCI